jgi:hypothetical protein
MLVQCSIQRERKRNEVYYACRPEWKRLIGSSRYSLEDNMKVILLKWGVEL